jgi:phosphatidate cytidylyltransferase
MGGALLAALYYLPPVGAFALVALLCGLGQLEFYALLKASDIPHQKWLGVLGGLALLVATWSHYFAFGYFSADLEWVILFAVLAAVLIRQMFIGELDRALASVASTMLGVLYIALLFNFINKLLLVAGIEGDRWREGRWLFFYLALVVKFTDVGAFFIGSRLGGKKFFPSISPAKTWSGVIGGLATGIAFSMLGLYLMQPHLAHLDFNVVDAIILGFLLSATGIIGDLIESMLKRASGVKDSGTCIQGMGGFLDVVDSLIFTAPVLYIYVKLFVDVVP